MTKYYRFISTDEYNALLDKGFVENKTARPLFLLSENPKTKILPENIIIIYQWKNSSH